MKLVLFGFLLLGCAVHSNAQVVVLAHPDSGDFIIVQNHPTLGIEAMQRANARKHAGDWKSLLSSTAPGYGAMFCFRPKGGQMRYFIAEGKTRGDEAIGEARAQANLAARSTGTTTAICGNWNNRNVYPLDVQGAPPPPLQPGAIAPAVDRGLMEAVRPQIRKQVTCDPQQNNCPPSRKPRSIGVRG